MILYHTSRIISLFTPIIYNNNSILFYHFFLNSSSFDGFLLALHKSSCASTIRRTEKDWWRREAAKSEALSRCEARARRRRVCTFLIVTKIIILWGEPAALTPPCAASKGSGEIKSPSPFVSYCSHVSTRSLRGICNFASAKLTARKGPHTGVAPLNNNKYV